ncbi:MAG: glycoside hydrolase TIM-barrel-like domain-containing protein [Planctomycetota bacterium]
MISASTPTRYAACCASLVLAAPVSATDPTAYDPGADPGMGFNLVSWWNFGSIGANVWETAVQEVYDAGFDEVSLSPVRYLDTSTGSIATSSQRGAELAHVEAGVVRAKQLGMTVTVNPFVEFADSFDWRGTWDPTPSSSVSNTFWADYQSYINEVAVMAEANGADSLNVGTELRALTRNPGNNERWHSLIDSADRRFSGQLGYAANWDNFDNANLAEAIWDHDAIDYLGIDAYFPIVTESEADASGAYPNEDFIGIVEDNWNELIDGRILPFVNARQDGEGLPVVFTEYGLRPSNRATVQHGAVQGNTVDTDEQIMGFDGLLRALDGRQEDGDILGMHIWQWGMEGSNGSIWNMDDDLPANQPNNVAATQWLADFVSNPAFEFSGDYNGDGFVGQSDLNLVLLNWGLDTDTRGVPRAWRNDAPQGVIGQAELNGVLMNWGSPTAPSFMTESIPEPSLTGLLLAGAFGANQRRRGRTHSALTGPRLNPQRNTISRNH